MRFASLGSGSRGNATLIDAGDTRVLVDCGFAAGELERRLAELGTTVTSLDGILVTHEHADHIRGVGPIARRYNLPIWMTAGTYSASRCGRLPDLRLFSSDAPGFSIGRLEIRPYTVPHDAREPCQYILKGNGLRFGMLTDAGTLTRHIIDSLQGCDALLLECNHDTKMLAEGPYPTRLQDRVGGRLGHLSNRQAAEALDHLDYRRLRHLVAAHLSEKNNSPSLVAEALLSVSPELENRLSVVSQDKVSGWFDI